MEDKDETILKLKNELDAANLMLTKANGRAEASELIEKRKKVADGKAKVSNT